MKKIKWSIALLGLLLCMTGCGEKPSAVLEKSIQKMDGLTNYKLQTEFEVKAQVEGIKTNTSISIQSDIDIENKTRHNKYKVNGASDVTSELYYIEKDGFFAIYTKTGDSEWKKQSGEEEEYELEIDGYNLSFLKSLKEVKKVGRKKDIATYSAKLDYQTLMENFSLFESIKELLKEDAEIVVELDIDKNYYITRLMVEVKDDTNNESVSVKLVSDYSDLGTTDVFVPADIVIDNVLDVIEDAKKSTAKSEANLIISGIQNDCVVREMQIQMGKEDVVACGTTLDAAEVKKIVPGIRATVSDVTLENGKVKTAVIVSNGYTIFVTDGVVGEPTK